jgi:hypothetical protein
MRTNNGSEKEKVVRVRGERAVVDWGGLTGWRLRFE